MKSHVLFGLLGLLLMYNGNAQVTKSHFKIRKDEHILFGHEIYKTMSFGGWNQPSAVNGIWSIEHWDGGLNVWRPYPALNPGNYYLFIDDVTLGVGIGRKPGFSMWTPIRLDVNGRIRSTGSLIISDEKYKSNISTIPNALEKVMKLRGVYYDFAYFHEIYKNTSDENRKVSEIKNAICKLQEANMAIKKEKRIGFIAQEIEKILPEVVSKETNKMNIV